MVQELVKDLSAIGKNKENYTHFGGTLITYGDNTAGTVQIYNVVDGQQRLVTVSLLLSSIADHLADTGAKLEHWSADEIRIELLKNSVRPFYKLRLQDGDDAEYRDILSGKTQGKGELAKAWRILKKAVSDHGPDVLMEGIRRFTVISFRCGSTNDPQQIFESLNATGKPLHLGEKVKNWILMGMDNDQQEDTYKHWCKIEKYLGVSSAKTKEHIDKFLIDFLRWRTGDKGSVKRAYGELRRWWLRSNQNGEHDKRWLCEQLCIFADLYGKITGTSSTYGVREIDRHLQHLRGVGIDVHRPFTLRLLNDARIPKESGAQQRDVIKVLETLSTWLTRFWLSNNETTSLNTTFARFARHRNGEFIADYSEYWIDKVRGLRYSNSAVPNEEEVERGIMTRPAAKSRVAARTILWALNSRLGNQADLVIENLSIEHIIPQTLNDDWKDYLGVGADELHGEMCDTLPNLTLVGPRFNSALSNNVFARKREEYLDSNVMLTRKLAKTYDEWREDDVILRSLEIAEWVYECWPWENVNTAKLRWRINGGGWKHESKYQHMLPNVVASLLDIDPEVNARRLSGDSHRRHIFLSDSRPRPRGARFLPIPHHNEYVVNVGQSRKHIAKLCKEMAKRCDSELDIEYSKGEIGAQDEWERDDPVSVSYSDNGPRWRIDGGRWSQEKSYRSMLPVVASALIDENPKKNCDILMGNRKSVDITSLDSYPGENRKFVRIPGYPHYRVYVHLGKPQIIKQCKNMGRRCDRIVDAE